MASCVKALRFRPTQRAQGGCILTDQKRHLVGIAQRDAHHALVARFKRNDVFARREYDFAERDHAFLADGLADHGKRLLADLTVGHDEVGVAHIDFVDVGFRNEFVDLNSAIAFDRDGFQFLRIKLDVFALVDLEAFDNVGLFDFVGGFGIDLAGNA
jgi:hypothetical protein